MTVVDGFALGRWDEPDLAVQASAVPPVEVLEQGELELLDAAPRAAPVDQLGLELADRRLRQGVVVGVAAGADRATAWTPARVSA